jgi:hypothetical protein
MYSSINKAKKKKQQQQHTADTPSQVKEKKMQIG